MKKKNTNTKNPISKAKKKKSHMMRFHAITLFPNMIESYVNESILGRAQKNKHIEVKSYDLRTFSKNKHKNVDDKPYGGGPGMVMSVDPIVRAIESIQKKIQRRKNTKTKIILFTPGGEGFTNTHALKWGKSYTDIILICGRYEGVDARVKKIFRAHEISIGNYVLTGGEIPALVIIDAMSRHVTGVLGNELSPEEARVSSHEIYTRPETYEHKSSGKTYKVPKVLLSGDHKKIDEWRKG